MEEGDLVTTPNWTWHDHYNGSDEPVVWLDGLDSRFVGYLGAGLREGFSKEQQPIEKPDGYSSIVAGHARPNWLRMQFATPPFRYPWSDTRAALRTLRESAGDPFDGIRLQYVNPFNGGPTIPTFSCEIQLLRLGEKTASHRHLSTAVYHAFRGQGVTTIDGEAYSWTQGDIFIIPPWRSHRHENSADTEAILFSVSDWPAMAALGLYREEATQD
jgi:gentisate 1,2-dioxygenase